MRRKAVWGGLAYATWRDGVWHVSQVTNTCTGDKHMCPWKVEYPKERQKFIADSAESLNVVSVEAKEMGGFYKKCFFQQEFKHSDLGNKLYRGGKGPRFFFVCSGTKGDAEEVGKLKPLREDKWKPVYLPVNYPKDRLWSDAWMKPSDSAFQ